MVMLRMYGVHNFTVKLQEVDIVLVLFWVWYTFITVSILLEQVQNWEQL